MTPARPIFRKLPARYGAVILPLILSGMMTCIVSGIATVNAVGFTAVALRDWPRAWAISWAVAFPTLLAVLPMVRWVMAIIVEQEG